MPLLLLTYIAYPEVGARGGIKIAKIWKKKKIRQGLEKREKSRKKRKEEKGEKPKNPERKGKNWEASFHFVSPDK